MWWLRNAALSYEMARQLEGTVEADERYHTAGQKGQAHHGGKQVLGRRARGRRKKREPGRGHDDKDWPAIMAWVSRQGAVIIQATKDVTVQTVQTAAEIAVRGKRNKKVAVPVVMICSPIRGTLEGARHHGLRVTHHC